MTVLLKWWLGLPVLSGADSPECPSCGEALDSFGDHLLCCRKGGFYQRHSAIVGLLWHLCRAQGLPVSLEVAVSDSLRPADLLISHWKGSAPLAVDVTVVHPLTAAVPFHAVKTGTEAPERVEQMKVAKYADTCEKCNTGFTPFALSTFGRLGPESQVLFQDLTRYLKWDGQEMATGDPVWGPRPAAAVGAEARACCCVGQTWLSPDFPGHRALTHRGAGEGVCSSP